jgi:heteromeric Ino2p/Ino4p transcription factor
MSPDPQSSPMMSNMTQNADESNRYPRGSVASTGSTVTPGPQSSSAPASSTPGGGLDKEKSRLSEQEKKTNHIASEQKRRAAIREGFDRLTELVPGLEGQGRSEYVVLKKTLEFMRSKVQERRELIAEIERIGGQVDDSFRT